MDVLGTMTSSNFSKFHLPGLYGIVNQNKKNWVRKNKTSARNCITVSCILQPKMIFNKKLYNIESSQLIFDTDQLTYLKVFLNKL